MNSKKPIAPWLAALLVSHGPNALPAQTAADGGAAPASSGEVVQMSQFEVTTTQGHGYVSTNSASGFKTNESLMDIPQVDLVMTSDMLDDIGNENTSGAGQFMGLQPGALSERVAVRGITVSSAYIDDMPTNVQYSDHALMDSIEIIKGPTQALYLDTPLSGVVIESTKKPLPFNQRNVSAMVNTNGLVRVTADLTGPIGKIGEIKLGYRLVGVWQQGNTYFYNIPDDRRVIFPEFDLQYHNTYVRGYYTYQWIKGDQSAPDLITPFGKIYTAAGRREANAPPNDTAIYSQTQIAAEARQKISDGWETRLLASEWTSRVYAPRILDLNGYDWNKQIEFFNRDLANVLWHYWSVLDDTEGKYNLGPPSWQMKNVDIFGYGYSSWTAKTEDWTTAPFGNTPLLPGQPAGTLAVDMTSVAAINAVHVPQPYEYSAPANQGSLVETRIDAIYWQHSIEAVPDWLTLTAAFTWENISNSSVTNISTLPFASTLITAGQWLHRLGAVLHLTKSVSVYALDATTFSPPGNALLQNMQLGPNQSSRGRELGIKGLFLGGRISAEAAWFNMTFGNQLSAGGTFPNGTLYDILIGDTVEEGVDGDIALTLSPQWQLIGTFYAGHDRTATNLPVNGGFDNSWSFFSRYDFSQSALKGVSVGGGMARIGGEWVATSGIIDAPGLVPASGFIKVKPGNFATAFLSYKFNRHLDLRVACNNILDETYVQDRASIGRADPSPPRFWQFAATLKF